MGSSASKVRSDVRVVILGGGYAGISIAKELMKQFDVTVVESRDRMYHNIGAPRALVEDVDAKLFIPYDRVIKGPHSRVLHGVATRIDAAARNVLVRTPHDGDVTLPYDYLIVATGMSFAHPSKPATSESATSMAALAATRTAVAAARDVVIVGGGVVGVEMAGEVATDGQGKNVTLIHSGPYLMHAVEGHLSPDRAQSLGFNTLTMLQEKGVRVILNTKAALPAPANDGTIVGRHVIGAGEERIGSDVTILATGGRPNSEVMRTSIPAAVNDAGFIRVNGSLLVEGQDRIFACGDVAATPHAKMAIAIKLSQMGIVTNNVRVLASATGTLQEVKPLPQMIALSLGRNAGTGRLGWVTLPSWLVTKAKSGDMLITNHNTEMGY